MSAASVTAVDRVIDIFEAFQTSQRPLSLTDLAEAVDIPKSTCHAIVATLTARGYLYSLTRPRSLYPTKRMHDVARDILDKDPFVERMTPMLERLRDTSRETIILGKRQGDSVVYLQVSESEHSIRYSAKPGDIKPMHSSSIGKALLGSMKEPDLRAWFEHRALPSITAATITDPDALIADILQSRRAGYFQTRGENVSDVWAVAAFFAVHNETLAVAVAGPRHRMETSLAECAQLLVATCSFISRQFSAR
ncbi:MULTISPECIES: IclR family transcriptional regulator [unclassified Variovorax]|uniref:IclR family transcriptional regulator n=1 Tax=unclassified Variovorax TaxID=663243 RepID=UPI00131883D6|nr:MULTISPECIES: IclR family transcriptional regulator [unclassified Variovorax]VTU15075.1 Acetate operon repressor [Variovorax sp. SRS16]VTU22518.1 Acetate operon repressor [Variovorax sp. PBL-E5]